MAGIAFPLADPHVLVRTPVGVPLYPLRHCHARRRYSDRLAPDGHRWTVVHLSHRPWMDAAQRTEADVHLTTFFLLTSSRTSSKPAWTSGRRTRSLWCRRQHLLPCRQDLDLKSTPSPCHP